MIGDTITLAEKVLAAKMAYSTERKLARAVLDLHTRLAAAERERDLAIAHDRQPYPTAWAYEQVCAALESTTARLAAAETRAEKLAEAARAGYSRLTLAHASMRSFLKSGDREHIEAWLLACAENDWLGELRAALAAGEGTGETGAQP